MRGHLLYPPTVTRFNEVGEAEVVPYKCYAHAKANHKVGDVIRCWVSAPGTGYVDYCITDIQDSGVYAVVLASTARELEPWEVA